MGINSRIYLDEKVENSDDHWSSDPFFYPCVVEDEDGNEDVVLFTHKELAKAYRRALRNTEDIPEDDADGLVAEYNFEGDISSSVEDVSGNENDSPLLSYPDMIAVAPEQISYSEGTAALLFFDKDTTEGAAYGGQCAFFEPRDESFRITCLAKVRVTTVPEEPTGQILEDEVCYLPFGFAGTNKDTDPIFGVGLTYNGKAYAAMRDNTGNSLIGFDPDYNSIGQPVEIPLTLHSSTPPDPQEFLTVVIEVDREVGAIHLDIGDGLITGFLDIPEEIGDLNFTNTTWYGLGVTSSKDGWEVMNWSFEFLE